MMILILELNTISNNFQSLERFSKKKKIIIIYNLNNLKFKKNIKILMEYVVVLYTSYEIKH